jgi:hypothetical protein
MTMDMRRTERPAPAIAALPRTAASAALYADSLLVRTPQSRKTALLLCIFLGWMGCHRFYVGKKGSGRLYLMTCGLFFVGVLVDLALILTDSFDDRYGQPLA